MLKQNTIKEPLTFFGGELRTIICGGASLSNETLKQYMNWNIEVLVGYGMTECSPVIVCNQHGASRIGSVGCIKNLSHCKIQIIEGEICISGSIVFPGYYKGEKTKGYFATGDLGYIDNENYLYITGRKKNIIVTPGGNNIIPELLEEKLCESAYIKDALVDLVEISGIHVLRARIIPVNIILKGRKLEVFIEQEIKKINREMPRYMRVEKIVLEKKFERTPIGKKRRIKDE